MAIRTRLSLLRLSQGAICICLAVLLSFFVAISCSAADMPSSVAPHVDLLWQMVVALLGFVNAVWRKRPYRSGRSCVTKGMTSDYPLLLVFEKVFHGSSARVCPLRNVQPWEG